MYNQEEKFGEDFEWRAAFDEVREGFRIFATAVQVEDLEVLCKRDGL